MLRLDLRRLMHAAWTRRVALLRFHAAVGLLAVGVVMVLPRWYASNVTLVPAPRDGLSFDLSGMGAGIGGASLSLGAGPTPQDQLKMVVVSRAVADSMVDRFDLVRRWHLERRLDAREQLAEHTTVTTPREGQVVVAVEARTPAAARDMAAAFAAIAGSETVRLKTSLASQRRFYLEARLRDLEREIGIAASRVRGFEEKNGAYALQDQARETMDAAGTLQAQVALLETELAGARRYFTDRSPEVEMIRDRIGALNHQIEKIARGGGTMLLKSAELPAMKEEYIRLSREQLSLTAVAELLRRFYEQARVEEANPVPTFSVLDAAELPERAARPRRGLTVLIALGLAALGSLVWLQWKECNPAKALGDPELVLDDAPASSDWPRRAA
jgi:capsule polysaccharide export protein KpsE/RkpR